MATKTRVECLLFVIGAGRGWLTQYKKTVCLCVCLNHSIVVCLVYYLFRIVVVGSGCQLLFWILGPGRAGQSWESSGCHVTWATAEIEIEDTQGWGDNYQHHWAIRENMSRNTRGNDSLSVYWELICEARGVFALQPQLAAVRVK